MERRSIRRSSHANARPPKTDRNKGVSFRADLSPPGCDHFRTLESVRPEGSRSDCVSVSEGKSRAVESETSKNGLNIDQDARQKPIYLRKYGCESYHIQM